MRLDLDGLADASREALTAEWREVVGRPPHAKGSLKDRSLIHGTHTRCRK